MNTKALRKKILDAMLDHLEDIEAHPQYEAIISFLFPDLYDFADFDEAVEFFIEQEFEENSHITIKNESHYDALHDDYRELALDTLHFSEFEINGKHLIWMD